MSLEFKNIYFSYSHRNSEDISVLKSFSIKIEHEKFTSIVGPSGSGKSTILKLLAGLLSPNEGVIEINGKSVEHFRSNGYLGLVFQSSDLLPWRTLYKNVQLSQEIQNQHINNEEIEKVLIDVGLNSWSKKYPHQLSGGMQQRAALARAIVSKPKILLLDEPFSQLDELLRFELLFYIKNYALQNKATVVLITHDISEAVIASDTIFVLSDIPVSIPVEIDIRLSNPRNLQTATQNDYFEYVTKVRSKMKELKSQDN